MKYIFLVFLPLLCFCQNNVIKIDYVYLDHNQANLNSSLYIKGNEALFKIYDTRETGIVDKPDGDVYHVENDPLSKFCYSNNEKAYFRFVTVNRELIYYDEYQSKTKWEIVSDSKMKIGKYNCTEARLRLNGRNYIAWFTYDIPIKYGPLKFHNLPGLIVEVKEEKGHLHIKLKNLSKTNDETEIIKHKDYIMGKKVMYNYKEYENKIIEFEVNHKISWIAKCKQLDLEENVTTTVNDDMANNDVIRKLLDVPPTLINELKKYRYN